MSDRPCSLTLTFPEPDIAQLSFDMPESRVNILSKSVVAEIDSALKTLFTKKKLAGLILVSNKPETFIAGADLNEFAAEIDQPTEVVVQHSLSGQNLFRQLATAPFVTVAAIHGLCLGGGAEMSMWCDRRILTTHPKTSYGFPEVKLGLFPGWGGTARIPRMIGLSNAIELITGGNPLSAKEAYQVGLANDLVYEDVSTYQTSDPAHPLLAASIRIIRDEQTTGNWKKDREKWSAPIEISETELGFLGATASGFINQQTKGKYPAPLAALEVMLGAAYEEIDAACQIEAAGFAEVFGSPVNRALLNVFFLNDYNKKQSKKSTKPTLEKIAVIGAGIMGQGIAAANIKRGLAVQLSDTNPQSLVAGCQAILQEASYNKVTKSADVKRAIELSPLLNQATDYDALAHSDLVIEAIIENPKIKKQVFATLEPLLSEHTILCSNTSTIPITELASDLKHPERFIGLHFFNPVRSMPLVEVIRGEKTSDQTVATVVAYVKHLGKTPVVMNDGPGFLVNRLLNPYMNEAAQLLLEGVTLGEVERAAKSFGMPMGPITLYDVVGLDTCVHAGKTMIHAFPERVIRAEIVEKLVEQNRLGQKNGGGFFDYQPAKRPGKPPQRFESQAVAELIASLSNGQSNKLSKEQIVERLFFPMLLEATRVLEDRLVSDVRDIDLALIFGIGFPPFKGGLFHWADTLGAAALVEKLKPYHTLGARYAPTKMLLEHAKNNRSFYP